ncbi:tRNA-dihydrouridine synthase [Anaerotaenia torta]|uniref:tRNA dihydrouridine synthase n=1 Tax=Anaerotaenia torta TaxID=433293 RepID=UPI003D2132BF
MNLYFAPMEGLTGYVYRNAFHKYFPGIDKYFSPFIAANQQEGFKSRDSKDILPENNRGLFLVPQLLANQAKDFIHTSEKIKRLGYEEINLNLGCPSGTVVAKNKGAGFLARREQLDAFLEEIFEASVTRISVKTRIGKEDPEEFYELIEIFNKYPITELIIHPRLQKDYYKNTPNMAVFSDAVRLSRNPLGYNGDIITAEGFRQITRTYPDLKAVMLGRGLLADPRLLSEITGNPYPEQSRLEAFHDEVYQGYLREIGDERNTLFKMKEFWSYFIRLFPDSDKSSKKIRKAGKSSEYETAVAELFAQGVN